MTVNQSDYNLRRALSLDDIEIGPKIVKIEVRLMETDWYVDIHSEGLREVWIVPDSRKINFYRFMRDNNLTATRWVIAKSGTSEWIYLKTKVAI